MPQEKVSNLLIRHCGIFDHNCTQNASISSGPQVANCSVRGMLQGQTADQRATQRRHYHPPLAPSHRLGTRTCVTASAAGFTAPAYFALFFHFWRYRPVSAAYRFMSSLNMPSIRILLVENLFIHLQRLKVILKSPLIHDLTCSWQAFLRITMTLINEHY